MTTAESGPFAPKPTDSTGYFKMQAAFASIKKKLDNQGASLSTYALLMWAIEDPACQAYYGPHPWLLKKIISLAVEQYCSDNLDETFSFMKAQPPKVEL